VKARSRIAALVAVATFAVAIPSRVWAQEAPPVSTTPWLVPTTDPESLRPLILAQTSEALARAQARVAIRGAATQELAVSREAGIIIIICAIVIGVIILVAIGAPHP
jgi:hypothetical protein